jgi:hypothetical protein
MTTLIRAIVIVIGLALPLGGWETAANPNAVTVGMVFGGIVLIALGALR